MCERTRSNVPQQALVLLNDTTYVEAARVFAEHIVRSGDSSDRRMEYAFRQALGRSPNEKESKLLGELLEKHLKEYTADEAAAKKLLATGDAPMAKDLNASELAAWTSVARTILNLHETITRN